MKDCFLHDISPTKVVVYWGYRGGNLDQSERLEHNATGMMTGEGTDPKWHYHGLLNYHFFPEQ